MKGGGPWTPVKQQALAARSSAKKGKRPLRADKPQGEKEAKGKTRGEGRDWNAAGSRKGEGRI